LDDSEFQDEHDEAAIDRARDQAVEIARDGRIADPERRPRHAPLARFAARMRPVIDAEAAAWERRRARLTAGTGRPPGTTTIVDDEQLREPIREMRRDRIRVTQEAAAARAGLSRGEIRGYLKATNRSWRDFLASF
jgi:hypothetical protein